MDGLNGFAVDVAMRISTELAGSADGIAPGTNKTRNLPRGAGPYLVTTRGPVFIRAGQTALDVDDFVVDAPTPIVLWLDDVEVTVAAASTSTTRVWLTPLREFGSAAAPGRC